MLESKDWTVEIRLAYDVKASSAEQALGAVLPLLSLGPERYGAQPRVADYTVREIAPEALAVLTTDDPLQGLVKPVYTAKEAAQILGISLNNVYTRIPSMSLGRLRRFSRAAILRVLEHGVDREPEPKPEPIRHDRTLRREMPAKIVRSRRQKTESPVVSITEAARMLRISAAKVRQLLEQRKIYYSEYSGRKTMPRQAVQNYIDGLTPRAFVEAELVGAEDDPMWRNDREGLEQFAAEWRAQWPDELFDRQSAARGQLGRESGDGDTGGSVE
ncbi:MAG TPA: helix-turn-helix domain-containing protein [Candidatus Tumulicola sp.]|nr:helix-turn-helix domain-containing protein [Candidatus Tumulicola sp.]